METITKIPKPFRPLPEKKSSPISSRALVISISIFHGLKNLAGLAMFMYQKEELKIAPSKIQFLSTIIDLPWLIKPVLGYLIDKSLKYVKKVKYILYFTFIFDIFLFSIMAYFKLNSFLFYVVIFFLNFMMCIENIIGEFMLVISTKIKNEKNEEEYKSNDLPIYYGFRAGAGIFGTFFGGIIIKNNPNQFAFMITSFLPIIFLTITLFYNEKDFINLEKRKTKSLKQEFKSIIKAIIDGKIILILIFVILLNISPDISSGLTFYLNDTLHFSTIDLANIDTFAQICYTLSMIAYSYYFIKINPKKLFLSTNIISWFVSTLFLFVVLGWIEKLKMNNKHFVFLGSGFSSLISELNLMPLLAIWCEIIPKDLEATSITLFTSLINLTGSISGIIGSFVLFILKIEKGKLGNLWIALCINIGYSFLFTLVFFFLEFPDFHVKKDEGYVELMEEGGIEKGKGLEEKEDDFGRVLD